MKKFHGLDLLRGIAAFGIVGCHLGLSQRTSGGAWVTALCNFNVGLFAAISGFLMNSGTKEFGEYVRKRAIRILPTYLIWSLVYVIATAGFDIVLDGGHLNERYYSLSNWTQVLFCGSAATHLWFLICLFYSQVILNGVNIVMEWMKLQNVARKMALGGASVALLVCSVSFSNWCCLYPVRLMAFLILGYLLKDLAKTDGICLPLAGVVFMLAIHLGLHGTLPGFVRDYLLAIPVIMLFVSNKFHGGKVATLLAATSMGVYLIHPLFARGASFAVARLVPPPYNAFVVLGDWIGVWLISLVVILVVLRIPCLKKFVK